MISSKLKHMTHLSKKKIHKKHTGTVFVYGNFAVIHPGHIRLFKFAAECGSKLVVGVLPSRGKGIPGAAERIATLREIALIDDVFLVAGGIEAAIKKIRPAIVVKGKEFESQPNPEKAAIEACGGKLIFSSGELFSSQDVLHREHLPHYELDRPVEYITRYGITKGPLTQALKKFEQKRVLVVGDLIIDEYIACDPLGMSREDPTIVVSPRNKELFLGGAGIVASHASSLGATANYVGIVGDDEVKTFAQHKFKEYGVRASLQKDASRPTTLKQRYKVDTKTLLRVSYLRHHEIDLGTQNKIFNLIQKRCDDGLDLVIFSDFNYGCLPQGLVDRLVTYLTSKKVAYVADSQSSSQTGDISRFARPLLITPTEIEARLALKDDRSGLPVLAANLAEKTQAEHVIITLGSDGVFIYTNHNKNGGITTGLPALNHYPRDVSGAGDALLVSTALALVSGLDIWASAYLGSLVAGIQVATSGNTPIAQKSLSDILEKSFE